MFRNTRGGGRDILPTSGNGRTGGMYGAARTTKPAISKSFIATIFWAMLSLGLMGAGWAYCSKRLESTAVQCDMRGCKIAEVTNGVTTLLTIPRMHMIRGELVRVKNGAIVDPSQMRRSAQRKLGHTYAVVYTEPDSEDDDDESYDSFEDDDDSYDSYEDDQDSSEEDDDEDDDLPRTVQRGGKPGQRPNPPPAKKPAVSSAKSSKSMSKPLTEEQKKAEAEKKEAARKVAMEKKAKDRARFAEERRNRGKEPVREPDEQDRRSERRQAAQRPMEDDEHDSDERFPGDAGTMQEKNRDEIARMEADQGMAARDHKRKSQQAYEEASKKHTDRHKVDQQTKQIGNNLQDKSKKVSPDDPDNKPPPTKREENEAERPKLERGEAQKDLSGGGGDGAPDEGVDTDPDEQIKIMQERIDQLKKQAEMKKAGGRTISSVGGLESMDEEQLSGEDEARREGFPRDGEAGAEEGGALEGGRDYETLGEFVHAGAAGARRKLLTWKNRVKNVDPPAAKRTREEIDRDAAKSRDAHRKGHGRHQKRAKKVAATVKDEVGAKAPEKGATHHHKAFHHKKEVPAEKRHHEHPGYHHRDGEKKIEHGWKHQNRQWHGHRELKKIGTSYNLGRSTSRKRKEAIDNYVSRRSHSVEFVDSKKWRAVGLWMMIVGFISASFCLIVGNFRPRPKTKKVS